MCRKSLSVLFLVVVFLMINSLTTVFVAKSKVEKSHESQEKQLHYRLMSFWSPWIIYIDTLGDITTVTISINQENCPHQYPNRNQITSATIAINAPNFLHKVLAPIKSTHEPRRIIYWKWWTNYMYF